jgi:hypothetical protein
MYLAPHLLKTVYISPYVDQRCTRLARTRGFLETLIADILRHHCIYIYQVSRSQAYINYVMLAISLWNV